MKLLLLAVFDAAIQSFMRPFTARSKAEALRLFKHAMLSENTGIAESPEDYSLYVIATVDLDTGEVEGQKAELLIQARYIDEEKEKADA